MNDRITVQEASKILGVSVDSLLEGIDFPDRKKEA